jgi:hypothetical protein
MVGKIKLFFVKNYELGNHSGQSMVKLSVNFVGFTFHNHTLSFALD